MEKNQACRPGKISGGSVFCYVHWYLHGCQERISQPGYVSRTERVTYFVPAGRTDASLVRLRDTARTAVPSGGCGNMTTSVQG